MELKISKVTIYGLAGHQPVWYVFKQPPPNITCKYLALKCSLNQFSLINDMSILYLPESHDFIFLKVKLYQYQESFQVEKQRLFTKEQWF